MTAAGVRSARRRNRGRLLWIAAPLAVLAFLAAAVVVVGVVARPAAEEYLGDRVEESLPDGVTGNVAAELGGSLLALQFLSGRMDDVRLRSDDLRAAGVPFKARLRLEGAPVDLSRPVRKVTGRVDVDHRAVEAILAGQGFHGDITLTPDGIQYVETGSLFGVEVEYTVTAAALLSGGRLDIVPKSVKLRTGPFDLDASVLLRLLDPDPMAVCLAEYLPASLRIDDVELGDDSGRIAFSGEEVVLTEEALARMGSCS